MNFLKLNEAAFILLLFGCTAFYLSECARLVEFKRDFSPASDNIETASVSLEPVKGNKAALAPARPTKDAPGPSAVEAKESLSFRPATGKPRTLDQEQIKKLIRDNKLSDKEAMFYSKK